MSAHQPGRIGAMSRRDFLNAAALAAAAGAVGGAGGGEDDAAKIEAGKNDAFLAEADARKRQEVITWTEATAAVGALFDAHLLSVPIENITGVALLTWDNGPKKKFIEVRWRNEKPPLPTYFDYHNPESPDPGSMEHVRVVPRERALLKQMTVRAGESAKGDGVLGKGGTLGWTIRYNKKNVCISAMHALCAKYNSTPTGTNAPTIFLGGSPLAKLHSYMPISWDNSVFNLWDIAMAEYNSGSDIDSSKLRPCGSGTEWAYPMNLAMDPTAANSYKKIGAGSPVCQRGYINGFGKSATLYDNGKIAYFDGQILLSAMATDSDSGAALIREPDSTVAGIIYAGDTRETVACPLFKAPLIYVGEFTLASGQKIPEFSSTLPPAGRCWV